MDNNTQQARFQFVRYLIDQCSVNLTGKELSKEMVFAINPEGVFNEKDKTFELVLNLVVNDKDHNLDLNIRIHGYFTYDGNNMDEVRSFIGINSPAILFPYVRAYVSNITALGGMPPVIMPTLNLKRVGEQLVKDLSV